jgi:hypothetical protein
MKKNLINLMGLKAKSYQTGPKYHPTVSNAWDF